MTARPRRRDTPIMPAPELASHRGGAFLWPENSLAAIRAACAFEAEQVEIDIHMSRDGEPVVMHDATLDRMTDGSGPVSALDWSTLQRLRVKGTGGEAIPHLREAASAISAGGKILRLEIKSDTTGSPYPGLVRAAVHAVGDRQAAVVMSFESATLAEAVAIGGFAQYVLLVDGRRRRASRAEDLIAACRAVGATELGLPVEAVEAGLARAVHEAGLRLSVWGANHAPTLRHALSPELALDAIATDDPPLAAQMRADAMRLRSGHPPD
ncbi:glycerophosphodiester phosphodiesterase [Sabulicella rubraurantiaca]|uniref:glycerophosphodiester phosphodiesterase n=1 Tax=Sabulicella rubraurantiaca TaxID=2811429 RepID=UPI001A95C7A0|nr:glycerophosphodiester phosphodiesterase family protein [Sabulicella rubraurantiaca]